MTDLLTTIKEAEVLVRRKHQPGQHAQGKHTPDKYSRAAAAVRAGDDLGHYQNPAHVDRIADGYFVGAPERVKVTVHDESTEEATKLRVEVANFEDAPSGDTAQFSQDVEDWYDPFEVENTVEGSTFVMRMEL